MPRPLDLSHARLPHPVWRADALDAGAAAGLPSGFAALDAQLPGGGWPVGTLTELIAREPGVGELRLLVPLLARLTAQRRTVLLLSPPHVPYAPALADFGIDPARLIVVQAAHAADRLWAVDQTLRSAAFGAMLAWLPHERTTPAHLRRMQLAAASCTGAAFLMRPLAAQQQASPAPLRLLLQPRPDERLAVRLLKRRGPLLEAALVLTLPQPGSARRWCEPQVAQAAQAPQAAGLPSNQAARTPPTGCGPLVAVPGAPGRRTPP